MDTVPEVGYSSASEAVLTIDLISADILPQVWNRISHWFDFLEDGEMITLLPHDLYQLISTGHMQLWIVEGKKGTGCAFVTEIISFPQTSICRICYLGGEAVDDWVYLVSDTVERWGASRGAEYIQISGRKGWARLMKQKGYKEAAWTIAKRIVPMTEH